MFKKTMKFDDLDGNEVEQTFYFNYNKKEIAELLEFGRVLRFPPRPGMVYRPIEEQLEKLKTPMEESGLTNQENNEQAYEIFESMLLDAYGVKGEDNVSFDKTPELRHYWSTHVAFPELVFEFIQTPKLATTFFEQCLPPRMVNQAKEEMQRENAGKLSETDLLAMIEESERRQQDPATRIEPGPEAAREAIGEDANIAKLAEMQASDGGGVPEKKPHELTGDDIREMDDIAFAKLEAKGLSNEALRAAYARKTAKTDKS